MMKILLFGKNGQVGWELQRALAPLGEVVALSSNSTNFCGDFLKPDGVADAVRSIKPDVIVNAAAYTLVDKAEDEQKLAQQINADILLVLAKEATALGAWFIHYSTDYVFDGEGDKPKEENDATKPLNVYGITKLQGENLIVENCPLHLIFRTSWVYSARGNNFAKTMLRLATERTELNVINDQIGAPTSAELIADCTAHVIRCVIDKKNQINSSYAGIYHLTASGETSWYEYAKYVFAFAEDHGFNLKLKKLNAINTDDYVTPAKRPLNSRLNTEKFTQKFNLKLPYWQQGVARMLIEILEQKL